MMSVAATTLVLMALGVEAAVYCPQNACLERTHQGTDATSFRCRLPADNGYQCAFESPLPDACKCSDGTVKYGNFQSGIRGNDTFTSYKSFPGRDKTTCDNTAFDSPISGLKICWCKPNQPVAAIHAVVASSLSGGLVTPQCLLIKLNLNVGGRTPAQLWAMGINKAVANTVVAEGIKGYFRTGDKPVKWIQFHSASFLNEVLVDCSAVGSCFGSAENALNKILTERTVAATSIQETSKTFITDNAAAFGSLAALAPALLVTFSNSVASYPEALSGTTTGSGSTTGNTGSPTSGGGLSGNTTSGTTGGGVIITTTTTTMPLTLFRGSMSIKATGVNKAQMENATQNTLADHFLLPPSAVAVTAVESRRLLEEKAAPMGRSRRLAGNWAIDFTIHAPHDKVAHIEAASTLLATNTTAFTAALGDNLVAAGAPASVKASLEVSGVAVVNHGPVGGGGNQTTTTASGATTRGQTSGSSRVYLSICFAAAIMMALSRTSDLD